MSVRLALFVASVALFAVANGAAVSRARRAPPSHGPPPPPLGPAHVVLRNLTTEQHQQLQSLLESAANETKAEIKANIAKFVATLSPALQVFCPRARRSLAHFYAPFI